MFITENPIHIKANADIAPLVIMPGDPLRAKYIAENFLENAKLVTDIRNMYGYTGFYQGTKVTVMAHGMGMPSASIYVFELIHYFHVQKIIRIGTCGAVSPKLNIGDIVLAKSIYSESNFAYTYNGYIGNVIDTSMELNNNILQVAKDNNQNIFYGMTMTTDVFGPYVDIDAILNRIPNSYEILSEEMEAYGVSHLANSYNILATTLMTVVDSKYSKIVLTPKDRETKLNDMIKLALDSIIL